MNTLAKLLYVAVGPLLKKFGWLTRNEAIAEFRNEILEADRLREEKIWRAEADIAIEKKHLEYQKMLIEHDRQALYSYALSIGVPVVNDRALH